MTTTPRNWDSLTDAEKRQARAISIHGGPGLAAQGITRTVPKHGWIGKATVNYTRREDDRPAHSKPATPPARVPRRLPCA